MSPPATSRRALLGLVLVVGAWACGCTAERPPSPPPPPPAAPAPPVAPPKLSRFVVPLDYDVTPVMALVERAIPRTFGSLDSMRAVNGDARKKYAYTATRAPFVAYVSNGEAHLRTTLAYAARVSYRTPLRATIRAGCGDANPAKERPRVVVELVAPLTLTPNWHLRSKTRVGRLAPATDGGADRCRVSLFDIDVTQRVVDAARQALTAQLPEIDRKVSRISLAPKATGWWGHLSRPIRLTDGVWLLLQPEQLRMGTVGGAGRVLRVQAGLDAYPKVVTGPEPRPAVRPLPALARGVGDTGFEVVMQGVIDYATASRAVTDALRGRAVRQAGRAVTVQEVTVAAAEAGRLAMTVRFAGDAQGTLRFVGTPRFDPARGVIDVPDLDYDLRTDNTLVNAVAWVRSDALRALFRERARVPVAPVLERGRALLTSGLNRTIGGALTLAAAVDTVTAESVAVTADGLVVQAGASGRARASVRAKGRPARSPAPAAGGAVR